MTTQPEIRAGTVAELYAHDGDWAFVDLGFSRAGKTCGFLHEPAQRASGTTENTARALTFGALVTELVRLVQQQGPPLHLVLEAPLSAAFGADGNPLGRFIEKRENLTRYWYVGCSVMVASLYLLKALKEADRLREIRLFEGLVSFKESETRSTHTDDVLVLRDVIWSGGTDAGAFTEPSPLGEPSGTTLASTLALIGLDISPPPIVQARALLR